MRGIVLIKAKPGQEEIICQEIKKNKGIDQGVRQSNGGPIEFYQLYYGPYDVVIEMKTDQIEKIGEEVIKIRKLLKEYIVETITLVEAE